MTHRKYLVDEETAAVVRQIFELATEGVTLRKIGRALQSYCLALPGDHLKTGKLYVDEGQESKDWYAGNISNSLGRGKNSPIKDDIFAGILFCGNC